MPTLMLADGTALEAKTWPGGSWECPFCGAPVSSPHDWEENERLNAEAHAAHPEQYADQAPYERRPYPEFEMRAWSTGGCPNPQCRTHLDAGQLEALRERQRVHAANLAQLEREAAFRRQMAEDSAAKQREAIAAAHQCCEQEGYCYACWSHSTDGGRHDYRVKWIRHKDPANCPRQRRYQRR